MWSCLIKNLSNGGMYIEKSSQASPQDYSSVALLR